LVSADSKKEWLERFLDLKSKNHKLYHIEDWAKFELIDEKWDVAFVDHAPGERRKEDIKRFKDNVKYIVVHDSETSSYGYEPVFSEFKYRYDFKRYPTWTTVVSNLIPIEIF